MHVFVVLTMTVATALTEENSCSGLKDERSFLSTLLTVTGYSDTCVAAALDFCGNKQNSTHVSLMQEAREVVQQLSAAVNALESQVSKQWERESLPRHCKDLLHYGDRGRGLRQIYPFPDRPDENVTVYCDHSIDGGGWTVIQRRTSDAVRQDFSRNWTEYESGFGELHGEFWLGLNLLHHLTSLTQQLLRIDLHDYDGDHAWAKYKRFLVGGPETKYRLKIQYYKSDHSDGFGGNSNGQPFSTYDADNDGDSRRNCAEERLGAWWYKKCDGSNLNGYQYVGSSPLKKGIVWSSWRGGRYSLKRVTMMIRPFF